MRTTEKRCSFIDCDASEFNEGVFFNLFPTNRDRQIQWIKASANESLMEISPNYLKSNFYICSRHFDTDHYDMSFSSLLTKLRPDAVPNSSLGSEADSLPPLDLQIKIEPDHMEQQNFSDSSETVSIASCELQYQIENEIIEPVVQLQTSSKPVSESPQSKAPVKRMDERHEVRTIARSTTGKHYARSTPKGKCAYIHCKSAEGEGITFHSFPRNRDIQIQWIEASGNERLMEISARSLRSRYHICSRHFDPKHYDMSFSSLNKRVRSGAVPEHYLEENTLETESLPLNVKIEFDSDELEKQELSDSSETLSISSCELRSQIEKELIDAVKEVKDVCKTAAIKTEQQRRKVKKNKATRNRKKDKSTQLPIPDSEKICAYMGCESIEGDDGILFHSFPKNRQKQIQWIKECGNESLMEISPDYLQSSFYLCSRHFNWKRDSLITVKNDDVLNPSLGSSDSSDIDDIDSDDLEQQAFYSASEPLNITRTEWQSQIQNENTSPVREMSSEIISAQADTPIKLPHKRRQVRRKRANRIHPSESSLKKSTDDETHGSRKRKCAYIHCQTARQDDQVTFHSFPKNRDIQIQWIDASGNERLMEISARSLRSRYHICSRHFDPKHYDLSFSSLSKTVRSDAVPHHYLASTKFKTDSLPLNLEVKLEMESEELEQQGLSDSSETVSIASCDLRSQIENELFEVVKEEIAPS